MDDLEEIKEEANYLVHYNNWLPSEQFL